MYRNTSKTGMHILYHIKIDIMSWKYLSCLWMHFLKTRRFGCELPLTFRLSCQTHTVLLFSVYHFYNFPIWFSVASVLLVRVQTRHPIKFQFNKKKRNRFVFQSFLNIYAPFYLHKLLIFKFNLIFISKIISHSGNTKCSELSSYEFYVNYS